MKALVGEQEYAASAKRRSGDEVERYFFDPITHQGILVDWRDARPGDKQYHWEQRGVPFRIEVGPQGCRWRGICAEAPIGSREGNCATGDSSASWLRGKLDEVQNAMLEKARKFTADNTRRAENYEQMKKILAEQGGFVRGWFRPDRANEQKIKNETKATVRCIPFDQPGGKGSAYSVGRRRMWK